MSQILLVPNFMKQISAYTKRFPHIEDDVITMLEGFQSERSQSIVFGLFKERMKSSDLQKGKSGGVRAILYFIKNMDLLIPVALYFKSDKENVSKMYIKEQFRITVEEAEAIMEKW